MVRRGSNGSSCQRAYLKCLQIGTLLLAIRRTRGHIPDTSAVRATHRDVSRRRPTRLQEARSRRRLKKLPANRKLRLPAGAGTLTPSPSREGVSEKGHRELASGVEVGSRSATNASSPVNVNGSPGLASRPSRSRLGRVSDA